HDLRAARHLQDELRERRPERTELAFEVALDERTLRGTDDPVVRERSVVRVEDAALLESDEVAPAAAVDEQYEIAGGEPHRRLRMWISVILHNSQISPGYCI